MLKHVAQFAGGLNRMAYREDEEIELYNADGDGEEEGRNYDGAAVTQTSCKRIVYFIGHKDQPSSALITKICKNYETVSTLLINGEGAARTLLNLYNLHAVRGVLSRDNQLLFRSSMSGPHHYFGWLDPTQSYTIKFEPSDDKNDNGGLLPVYHYSAAPATSSSRKRRPSHGKPVNRHLKPVGDEYIKRLSGYEWMKGADLDAETRKSYAVSDEIAVHLVDTESGQADSLFDAPGVLALAEDELEMRVIEDPYNYDLSPYRAQIVPNHKPFAFDQDLVARHPHAQVRLRVITYNYAEEYLENYLMRGSGVFIERHEFIQAITPMNEQCGGFVLLGREDGSELELVAARIPYGYTLLVDVLSVHGDSTLTGMYMMAMTGDHHAMQTADSVFMKNRETRRNVAVRPIKEQQHLCEVEGLSGEQVYLTSSDKPIDVLRDDDAKLQSDIRDKLGKVQSLYWRPVIANRFSALISATGTFGSSKAGAGKALHALPEIN